MPPNGRQRAVVEAVRPVVDGGRLPIKRCVGEMVVVEAVAFCDGADSVRCQLLWRHENESDWRQATMIDVGEDTWRGEFVVDECGSYRYRVLAWVDHFFVWRKQLEARVDADDILLALRRGAELVGAAAQRAADAKAQADQRTLVAAAEILGSENDAGRGRLFGLAPVLAEAVGRYPDLSEAASSETELTVWVDRVRARYGAWYEMFPRSCVEAGEAHGSFASCERRLPYVAAMGFDVLYLPPIHPIGTTQRKGANNALSASAEDPGSPWAIGSAEGGHKAIHPLLGDLSGLRRLIAKAAVLGIEIALDVAFQCSPDHPWVEQHPDWFRRRADGSVQYAENPPKKYQDIYPLDFETNDWRALWQELKSVFDFWIKAGVLIFRVDNPHTKALAFWQWLIAELHREQPQVILLAEAFTRPHLMYRLARVGFAQSYTYFTWRNTRAELTSYFGDLTQSELREYFRPNLFANTPDILTEYLQFGGRPAFLVRLVLAATLGASYGIYGPPFELMVAKPREPGSEEYFDSEKYAVRHWDLDDPASLKGLIAQINRIRREHAALQQNLNLEFYAVDNEQLISYGKFTDARDDVIIVVVNLDPHHVQSGWVSLPVDRLAMYGIGGERAYQMHDLLADKRYYWQGTRNFVSLDPAQLPAHIFHLRRSAQP
jgi:starch synthase (maltosyl-transferring)